MIKEAILTSPHTKKMLTAPLRAATETVDDILDMTLRKGKRAPFEAKKMDKLFGKRAGGEMLTRAALVARHPLAVKALTSNVKLPIFQGLVRKKVRNIYDKVTKKVMNYGKKIQSGNGIIPRMKQRQAMHLMMQDKMARARLVRNKLSRQKGGALGGVLAGIIGGGLLPLGFDLLKKQFGGGKRKTRRSRKQTGGIGPLALLAAGGFLPVGLNLLTKQLGGGRGSVNKISQPALLPPISTRPITLPPTKIPVTTPVIIPTDGANKKSAGTRVLDKILASGGVGDKVLNAAGNALISKAFGRSKSKSKRRTSGKRSKTNKKPAAKTTRHRRRK